MNKKKFFDRDRIFYIIMMAFPVLQFCVFYIGVNGRSLLYSFQNISGSGAGISWTFDNIKYAWETLTGQTCLIYFKNSLVAFLLTYFIGTFLALLFSYFIFKKLPFGGFFKVFLFLPSILSAIVLAVIFLYFCDKAVPAIGSDFFHKTIPMLLSNKNTRFGTIIFYNIFIGFGTGVLMYSNAMSGISTEVIEAAKLDGCSPMREFFSIVLPSIFPTISTFAITSVATLFTNQLSLFSLYGTEASNDVMTIGYYLYKETVAAGNNETAYPKLCALGLLLTIVAVPLTLLVKHLLEKYGPSED